MVWDFWGVGVKYLGGNMRGYRFTAQIMRPTTQLGEQPALCYLVNCGAARRWGKTGLKMGKAILSCTYILSLDGVD